MQFKKHRRYEGGRGNGEMGGSGKSWREGVIGEYA